MQEPENGQEHERQGDRETGSGEESPLHKLWPKEMVAYIEDTEREWKKPKPKFEIRVSTGEALRTAPIAVPAAQAAIAHRSANRPLSPRQDEPAAPADFDRHSRKCVICRHSDRESIDAEFLNWHSPSQITVSYDLPDYRCIYTHARAAGLYALRRHNMRAALELIIEKAEEVKPTADAIIRAVRACTCLADNNQWTEPASRVNISVSRAAEVPELGPKGVGVALGLQNSCKKRSILIRTTGIRKRRKQLKTKGRDQV